MRRVIFEFLEKNNSEGWWGDEKNAGYYSGSNNPFVWIQVHPVRTSEETKNKFHGDHSGRLETSEMMALCPKNVDMTRFSDKLWYARTATDASKEYGADAAAHMIADMRKVIFG